MLTTALIHFFRSWPPQLATALLAAVPVTEVRAAIPIGIGAFHLSPVSALLWAFLGSLIPMPFVLWLFPPFLRFVERHWPSLHQFMEKHVRELERKHRKAYERFGALAIFLFIALPIPGSGVWSASVLAVIFDIDLPYAVLAITSGIAAASLLVLGVTLGAIRLF